MKLHWKNWNPAAGLRGLVIVLVVVNAWLAGSLIARLFQPVSAPPLAWPRGMPETTAPASSSDAPLHTFRLFGQAASASPVSPPPVTVRRTRLNATLAGTLVGPQGAVALIRYRNELKVLETGERLAPGITVETIAGDHVVLNNRGRLERLTLERPALPAASVTTAGEDPAVRTRLREVKRRIRQQPLGLLEYVQVEMLDDGLKIRPARDPALFRALGFEPEDVIVAIDGQPIRHWMQRPADAMALLQREQVNITVRRQGRQQTLTLSLME